MSGSIDREDGDAIEHSPVGVLASSVIGHLIEVPGAGRQKRLGLAARSLYQAATSNDPFLCDVLLQEFADLRVGAADLIDHTVGQVARALGRDWETDALSFAEVSRASARIYGLCKVLGEEWSNLRPPANSQTVLLATVASEAHLIGPTVLAQQLRRDGHSVSLLCNAEPAELIRRMDHQAVDCLMISSASHVGLDCVARVIRDIRRHTSQHPPIILGGAGLEFCGNHAASIGADLVTNDEKMALEAIKGAWDLAPAGAAE